MVVDSINYPTLRDTLWAIRTLAVRGRGISELYLGYECKMPVRIHMWGSIVNFGFTIPAKGEFALHKSAAEELPEEARRLGAAGGNETNSTFKVSSLASNLEVTLKRFVEYLPLK